MDFFGAIINGLLTTVAYVVIFLGVYKLFQIATDIREIKNLVVGSRRVPPGTGPSTPIGAPFTPASAPAFKSEPNRGLSGEESAAAYAEHLLRTVNADRGNESAPQEVR